MNWNVFFEVITWCLVVPAGFMMFVGLFAWLYDAVDGAGRVSAISAIVFIILVATIGGMGWTQ